MIEARSRAAFAEAFDAAVRRRGVTLSHLHRRLTELATPVSVATLSYWRSGRSEPERQTSLEAVGVLEELLGMDDDALVSRLRPVRRAGPPVPVVPIEELVGNPDAVRRALAHLDFETAHDELAEEAVALSIDVDEHGRAHRLSALMRWRALCDRAQRAAFVLTMDDPDEAPPVIVPRAGVDLGREYVDTPNLLHVSELLLERPLARGEVAFGEYEVALDGIAGQDGNLGYYATRKVSQALVWVRFHPDRLPVRFEAFDVVDGQERVESMSLAGGRSLHRRVGQYGPGTIGIRWFW